MSTASPCGGTPPAEVSPDRTGAGRSVLVTGASSGIGWHAARGLAERGVRVLLGSRDPGRGRRAADALAAAVPGADVRVVRLDLADLGSVVAAAQEVASSGPLHGLLANGGLTGTSGRRTSAQGSELMLATNHLGHAALVALLLPSLAEGGRAQVSAGAGPARVVGAGSIAHRFVRPPADVDGWQSRRGFVSFRAYSRSKLAVLLHTAELDRRLVAAGAPVRALAFHPGYAVDVLDDVRPQTDRDGRDDVTHATRAGARVLARAGLLQGKAGGARPAVAAVLGPSALDGAREGVPAYVGPTGPAELAGGPALVRPARTVADRAAAQRLWVLTQDLVGDATGVPLGPSPG
ncbi:SDR family NAD(P)-dependent oxidoreductase [Pseudokineococcus basanitobsidens]|uniref:SDR family NAD(P)-dependent oxidoreductase n=1 Tax=Pseudokineococcus basanitobsidens TaxID=1926649 RepID=A0ABU8RHU0_9ACTN